MKTLRLVALAIAGALALGYADGLAISGGGVNNPTYTPTASINTAINLATVTTTTLVNVSEVGELFGVALSNQTAGTGTATGTLNITLDGGTTQTWGFTMTAGVITWTGLATNGYPVPMVCNINCSTAGASNQLILFATYKVSLLVTVGISVGATSGTVTAVVNRGIKS